MVARSRAVTALDLERDRRLVPRLYVRVLVAGVSVLSALALARGEGLPVLVGADPRLSLPIAWSAALLHLGAGIALLLPASRRGAAAALGVLLLGWMAFLGADKRYAEAVGTAVLLILALQAASPEDEGPWKPRTRGWGAELAWVAHVLVLGLFARLLLGRAAFYGLALLGAALHARTLRRMGAARSLSAVLLLWVLLFWVGVGAGWSLVGGAVGVESVSGPLSSPAFAAVHLALAGAGFACFWRRDRWLGTALAAALLLSGVGVARGLTAIGGTDVPTLALEGLIVPVVILGLAVGVVRSAARAGA